jgi:hypothetical protein
MNIDTDKYSLESLKFIHQQSLTNLGEIWSGFREITNKSYTALVIYAGIATKIVLDFGQSDYKALKGYLFFFLLITTLIPIIIVFKNILPTKMSFKGADPNRLLGDYFEFYKEQEQEKKLIAFMIEMQSEQIKFTRTQLKKRVQLLNYSIFFALIPLIILLCIYSWSFIF